MNQKLIRTPMICPVYSSPALVRTVANLNWSPSSKLARMPACICICFIFLFVFTWSPFSKLATYGVFFDPEKSRDSNHPPILGCENDQRPIYCQWEQIFCRHRINSIAISLFVKHQGRTKCNICLWGRDPGTHAPYAPLSWATEHWELQRYDLDAILCRTNPPKVNTL